MGHSSRDQHSNNNQQPRPLKMKSFATLVLLNFALARPDHGVVHHGAHHTVHHQPSTVHHAVHHQPATVHHAVHQPMLHHAVHHSAVHHQPVHHVAPVVAKAAPKTIAELVETLSGEGSFTVFAPTNEAFNKVPSEALAG